MKNFKEYFIVNATPEEVFNALTQEPTIQLWSGEVAEMQAVANTPFSMFDGSIEGMNLEFEPGRKIVQEWYFGDQEDPSIATIILHPHKHGTSAEVRHTNIPDEAFENISEGWRVNYFESLIEFYS